MNTWATEHRHRPSMVTQKRCCCTLPQLDPGAQAVEAGAQQGGEPQASGTQQSGGQEDEGHVGQYVHHGQPVNVQRRDVAESPRIRC